VLGAFEALDETLALEAADGLVVEADVVVGAAVLGEAVVVDGGHALGLGVLDDGGAGARVEVDGDEDVDAAGEHLVGDGLEVLAGALGVLDVVVDAGRFEGRFEVAAVGGLPPVRGGRVGKDDADERGVAVAAGLVAVAAGSGGEGQHGCRRETDRGSELGHWGYLRYLLLTA